jgi:hypothetical protein
MCVFCWHPILQIRPTLQTTMVVPMEDFRKYGGKRSGMCGFALLVPSLVPDVVNRVLGRVMLYHDGLGSGPGDGPGRWAGCGAG